MDQARLYGAQFEMTHRHGSGEWTPMREHHDPADHDAERDWVAGKRIFTCDCGDAVAVTIRDDGDRQAPGE